MLRVAFVANSSPYALAALQQLVAGAQRPQSNWEISLVARVLRGSRSYVHRLSSAEEVQRLLPEADEHRLSPMEVLGGRAGAAVLRASNVNSPSTVAAVGGARVDAIVTAGLGQRIGPELLAVPRLGGINAHPSRLPQLRGPAPVFWVLRNGWEHFDLTVHQMTADYDRGLVYAHEPFNVPLTASSAEIFQAGGDVAGRLLSSTLDAAAEGRLQGVPQDDSAASEARLPRPEDGFVNPREWDCRPLVRFVSGVDAYVRACAVLGGKLAAFRTGLRALQGDTLPSPGFRLLDGNRVQVQCRDGVAELQLAGAL